MVRILFNLLFLCCVSSTNGQNVRIYGNILENTDYSTVILSPAVFSKLLDSKIETSPKKGFFEFNITVSKACFYKLYYKSKRIQLFVKPGAKIQLTIDNTKSTDYCIFYEDMVQENTLLSLESTPYLGIKQDRDGFKKASLDGLESYFKEVDKAVKLRTEEWNTVIAEVNLCQEFMDLYPRNYIEMASYLYKYYYPKYRGFEQDSFIALHPNFLDFYKSMSNNSDFYFCPLYIDNRMNVLKAAVNTRNKDLVIQKNVDDLELYKSYIREAEQENSTYLREILIENLIGEWVNSFGRTSDLKQEIVSYIDRVQDADKKTSLKKRLVNLAQYETGQPAPNFSFEEYSGNKRHSRELVGKIVYITVWSSASASSMNELKAAKEIYAIYKDQSDFVFLYLSIDEDKNAWEKTLRDQKLMDEIQAISFPNGFNSDFARKYAIQSLPAFILIDKSGNIISNRVPRPSLPEKLIPLLDKLLGK